MYNMSSFGSLAPFFTSFIQKCPFFLFKNYRNGVKKSHVVLQPQMCLLYHPSPNDGDDKRMNILHWRNDDG
jgi:hypothetical protein